MSVTYYAVAASVLTALVAFWVTGLRRRLDFVGVLLWAAVTVAGTAAALVAGPALADVAQFGYVNVAFRQIIVGLPLASALIALRAVRRGWRSAITVVGMVVVAGTLLLAPLGVYMTMIEPNRLVVRTANLAVDHLPPGPAIKVGVISDLQTTDPGPHEQAAVAALMASHPDVILFAGDVFQAPRAQFTAKLPALRRLFQQLRAPGGVYIVEGDVDTVERLQAVTNGTGVQFLSNEIATAQLNGRTVVIGGLRLDYQSPQAADVVRRLDARSNPAELRILLSHRPDGVELLPEKGSNIDLVVSGHTHGGQVVVPFFGPIHTLTHVPRSVAAGGLHQMGERSIFVGTGVGVERNQAPKMRLFDPPSVAVVTVTPSS